MSDEEGAQRSKECCKIEKYQISHFATLPRPLGALPEATHLHPSLGHDGPARLARVPLVDHVEAAHHHVARQLRHALQRPRRRRLVRLLRAPPVADPCSRFLCVRELPDMMSASERGGESSRKSGRSKGDPNANKGGRGSKNPNILLT